MAATLAAPRPAAAAIPAAERAALVALYNSTNGAAWTNQTNWRNPGNTDFNAVGTECSWFGVVCGSDRVVVLDLRANNLTGALPNELGNLSQLIALYLFSNQLTGSTGRSYKAPLEVPTRFPPSAHFRTCRVVTAPSWNNVALHSRKASRQIRCALQSVNGALTLMPAPVTQAPPLPTLRQRGPSPVLRYSKGRRS